MMQRSEAIAIAVTEKAQWIGCGALGMYMLYKSMGFEHALTTGRKYQFAILDGGSRVDWRKSSLDLTERQMDNAFERIGE